MIENILEDNGWSKVNYVGENSIMVLIEEVVKKIEAVLS